MRQIQGQTLGLSRVSSGAASTGVWQAFRQVVPWQQEPLARPEVPPGALAYSFLQANSPAAFFPPAANEPKLAYKARIKRSTAWRRRARRRTGGTA